MFKALLLESSNGTVSASVRRLEESKLPAGNVTVGRSASAFSNKTCPSCEAPKANDVPWLPMFPSAVVAALSNEYSAA